MKKLTNKAKSCVAAIIVAMTCAGSAFAYDTAKIQVEITGAQKSSYFLCVSSVGCVSMNANKEVLPINATGVRYIFLANRSTYEMYPQNLPSSCNVTVNNNQKLVVKGSLTKGNNEKAHITNLHCVIA